MLNDNPLKFAIPNVRISYPALFNHGSFGGQSTEKYEATFILDKKAHKAEIAEIITQINRLMKEELKTKLPADKVALKDGDESGKFELEGKYVIKASTKRRPLVLDRDKSPLVEEDNKIYGGCYVNVIFTLWVQNNTYGKRVNAQLDGVQFARDGEPLGDSGLSASAFDAFGDGDDIPF